MSGISAVAWLKHRDEDERMLSWSCDLEMC